MSRAFRFFSSAVAVAFGALRRNLLRSVLTAFGVTVGVAAVTIVVALGEGASATISGTIDTMGTNKIDIRARRVRQSGVRNAAGTLGLSLADAEALGREGRNIERAGAWQAALAQASWQDANVATSVMGATLDYFSIANWKIDKGSLWKADEAIARRRVCVLGHTVAVELFAARNPVGQSVRIGRHTYRVTGVFAKKGQNIMGRDPDDHVFLPITTFQSKVVPTRPGYVQRIELSAVSAEATPRAAAEATAILRQRHGLAEGAPNDFRVRTQEQLRQTQEEIVGVLQLLLLSVALVSLVVGGIGVMNIMLVSVTERAREIGIRLAIGAKEADILAQFLVEALVLAVLGGMTGAVVAFLGVISLAGALEFPMQLSSEALVVAIATSTAVGLLFGFLPARRAARLDPIAALRLE